MWQCSKDLKLLMFTTLPLISLKFLPHRLLLQFPFPRPFSDNMCISMMLSCSNIIFVTWHVMASPIAWTAGDLSTHLTHFYPFWCFSFFSFPFFPWPAWHFDVTRCLGPHMISNRPIWLTFQWLQHMRVNFFVSLNGITLSYVCIQLLWALVDATYCMAAG